MVVALLLQCVAPTLMHCTCQVAQSASQPEKPWRAWRLPRLEYSIRQGQQTTDTVGPVQRYAVMAEPPPLLARRALRVLPPRTGCVRAQLREGVAASGWRWEEVRRRAPQASVPKLCRVGQEVPHPGPWPAPDKEISTIWLFRRCDPWLLTPDPDRDPWVGQRPLSEKIRKPLPRETLALAATTQPLVPRPLRCFDEQ